MTLTKFKASLPLSVKELIKKLNDLELRVGFIGGVTRDFLLKDEISKDIDIEIRSNTSNEVDMNALAKELGGSINKEFKIITIDLDAFSVEVGLPRIEVYRQSENGHKNFDHHFSYGYEEEFERRDFTLNAIMFEYYKDESRIVDPKGGVKDLEDRLLKVCSNDFVKDPVRALRAYRFSISKKFQISVQLENMLRTMEISNCSSFYIKSEAIKSTKPLSFLERINLIENFSDSTVYDSNEFSLAQILSRDISISNAREVLKRLELSRKGLLSYTASSDIAKQYELLTNFVNYNFYEKEMMYILSYLKIDHTCYKLKRLENIEFNPKLGNVDKKLRKQMYVDKLLEEIKK